MLAEGEAVVAHVVDDGLVEQVLVGQLVHQPPDPLVEEGDLGGVQLAHALDGVVVHVHVDHPRVRRLEWLYRDDPLQLDALGAAGRDLVDARRVERLVRVEGVDPEEEGALLLEVVEQIHAAAHDARRRVLAVAVAVDRVPTGHRPQAADLDAVRKVGQQVALDRAARGGALERLVEEAVGALGVARPRPVECAPEVGKARPDQERVVRAVGGLDAGLAQGLGDDRVVVGDRDPARADRQPLGRHVVSEWE